MGGHAVVFLLAVLGGLHAGCTLHSSYDVSSVGPAGIVMTAQTHDDRRIQGEVLAVEDEALILKVDVAEGLETPAIVRLPYARLRSGRFQEASSLNLSTSGQRPSKQWRETLRRRSRYPQGLSSDVLSRLLNAYDQSSLLTMS